MKNDLIWYQVRVFFHNQENSNKIHNSEYSKLVVDCFTTKKFELMKKFVKPIRNEILGKIADRWHFVGTYHKNNKIYIDIRFRIYKKYIEDFKLLVIEYSKSLIDGKLITDLEFDENFYQKYVQRFTSKQIDIITETLQLFCNQYLELISSFSENDELVENINEEIFSLLGEVNHLILFQAGIDDKIFHLVQAFKWSKNKTIIEILISILALEKPLFNQELQNFENEIQIPKLLEIIKKNSQKK